MNAFLSSTTRLLLFAGFFLAVGVSLAHADDAADTGAAEVTKKEAEAKTPAAKLYDEALRPQFHFSPAKNWTNDPNGLVYFNGEYHLFFQHNPEGINWGNMTWGHAVSKDLMHWKQLEHAILPDHLGTIFSGSAVIDHNNTSGFQTGDEPPLVAIYTYAGDFGMPKTKFTQAIAYSNDRGRTFTKYEGNPVVGHILAGNRDPKVFWHKPSKQWVMNLYLDRGKFILMGSKDLKKWEKLSDLPFENGHECPEFFELAVDGNENDRRWVFWEAGGRHIIGKFDGKKFTPETEVLRTERGNNCYAGQTWNNIPSDDGRRIFIGWMAGGRYPGMPFNQQMSIPCEFTLRTTDEGVRLFSEPVREVESLRGMRRWWKNITLSDGVNPLKNLSGQLYDLEAVIDPGEAKALVLDVRGHKVRYDVAKKTLSYKDRSAEVALVDGKLKLRVLIDRSSFEIFVADGRTVMSFCFVSDADNRNFGLQAEGGVAKLKSLDVYDLRSTWPK